MADEIVVLGAPTDFGANRRGVDMGPSAIRYAGLEEALTGAGIECIDAGDVTVTGPGEAPHHGTDPLARTREIAQQIAGEIRSHRASSRIPLLLGGDHSVSLGSLHGVSTHRSIGVVWFDAHGDFNTPETTPSGNVHGMTLAAAVGHGSFAQTGWGTVESLAPENVVLVGTRDLDDREAEALEASSLDVMTMATIDRDGIANVCERALRQAGNGVDAVHVSLDMDFLDPLEAPGVGTPVRGGATYREAHLAMELVASELWDADRLAGFDLVEVNPIRDRENETAALATELAASAFGKQIL